MKGVEQGSEAVGHWKCANGIGACRFRKGQTQYREVCVICIVLQINRVINKGVEVYK